MRFFYNLFRFHSTIHQIDLWTFWTVPAIIIIIVAVAVAAVSTSARVCLLLVVNCCCCCGRCCSSLWHRFVRRNNTHTHASVHLCCPSKFVRRFRFATFFHHNFLVLFNFTSWMVCAFGIYTHRIIFINLRSSFSMFILPNSYRFGVCFFFFIHFIFWLNSLRYLFGPRYRVNCCHFHMAKNIHIHTDWCSITETIQRTDYYILWKFFYPVFLQFPFNRTCWQHRGSVWSGHFINRKTYFEIWFNKRYSIQIAKPKNE